jgi:hypothetical protein
MPNIHVELTDTLDMWRQKTNSMMDVVYSLTGSGVIAVSGQTAGQILVSDGSMFRNVTPKGDVSGIDNDGTFHINPLVAGPSKGRMSFAGSMRSLY